MESLAPRKHFHDFSKQVPVSRAREAIRESCTPADTLAGAIHFSFATQSALRSILVPGIAKSSFGKITKSAPLRVRRVKSTGIHECHALLIGTENIVARACFRNFRHFQR